MLIPAPEIINLNSAALLYGLIDIDQLDKRKTCEVMKILQFSGQESEGDGWKYWKAR